MNIKLNHSHSEKIWPEPQVSPFDQNTQRTRIFSQELKRGFFHFKMNLFIIIKHNYYYFKVDDNFCVLNTAIYY